MSQAQTNNAATEIKFKDDLLAFKDKVKPLFQADKATGTITLPAGKIFELAPEGVTEATYEGVRKFTDLVNNALTLAGTEAAVELMKENKELQEVTLHAPLWKKDNYEGVFKRQGTSRNVKTGEVSNYAGALGVGRVNIVSTRTQAEWQAIKQNMRNLAESAGL